MKKYIVNDYSIEIHRLKHNSTMCKINPNKYRKVNWFIAIYLIWFKEYDGCKFCWPNMHWK